MAMMPLLLLLQGLARKLRLVIAGGSTWCLGSRIATARVVSARLKCEALRCPLPSCRHPSHLRRCPYAAQPFCDGSERAAGSPFEPLSFVCDQQQTFYLLCGW